MKLHTQDYKTNIKNYGRKLDSKITYTINEVETELGKNQLNSVTPHFEGDILKSTMKQIDIDANIEIPLGTILNYQFGVKVDDEYEYINYGNYIVYKVEKQEDTNSYMMTCYDKMLYAMKDYEDLGVTYPITIKEYIQALCNKLGLVFKNADETFPNYDKQIDKELYLDSEGYSLDYTYRDVLDELAQVTASTICINDNDELELRYIKDATYNKTATAEGDITIQDGTETSLVGCNIEGNSYQYTTTGKNLFDKTTIIGGWIRSDGRIYNEYTDTYGYTPFIKVEPNTTYTLNLYNSSNLGSAGVNEYSSNADSSFIKGTSENQRVITITTTTNTQYIRFTIRLDSKDNVQFELGNQATTYEPYTNGASPNPDYPQEVEVVDTYNLFNPNNVIDGYTSDSTGITTGNGKSTNFIEIEPNASYYFLKAGITSGNWGAWYNSSKTYISGITLSGNDRKVLTSPSNAKYLKFTLSYQNNNPDYAENVMIIKSIEEKQYIPYNNIATNIKSQNMVDKLSTTPKSGGVTFSQDLKSVTVNYANSGDEYFKICDIENPTTKAYTLYFEASGVNANETPRYTIYGGGSYHILTNGINVVNVPSGVAIQNSRLLLDDANKAQYPNTATITFTNFMLVEGTYTKETIGNYVPYSNITTSINLQNNFIGKIGSIKDELNIDDLGNVILTKRIGKVVLNGSETYSYTTNYGGYRYKNDDFKINSANPSENLICSHFKIAPGRGNTSGTIPIIRVYTSTSDTQYIFLCDGTSSETTFKNWLQSNNVTIYYQLATPYTINLGKANIELNEGVNYITFLTNLDSRNTIEYGYEKEQIDERFLKDINVDFGKKYGPINSIVLSRSAESDSVYLQDEDSIEANGLCELKITDNQIMNWQNRSDFLPDILNQLDGLEYYINDYSSTGITYLELCDRYEVKIKDNVYSCIMFNDELDVTTGIQEMIHTDEPKQTETDYKKADKTDRKINQAYIIVDKQQNEITAQANRINIIATHIDETTGDVREVTTTTGFTFNADGLNIYKNDTTFNTQINNIGTYYKDGDTILSQTTKDGTKTKDLDVFGYYRYGEDDINDDPLFIAVKYTDGNDEEGYGHFYNG